MQGKRTAKTPPSWHDYAENMERAKAKGYKHAVKRTKFANDWEDEEELDDEPERKLILPQL